MARQRDEDAWADRGIARAWTGVDDEALAQGLRAVLEAARPRRDAHDEAFGRALAVHTERNAATPAGLVKVENLLASTVMPLAKQAPVLLVVADGMSQAVAAEVVDDVVRRYDSWLECLPAGQDRRVAAIAALPSLTKVCRASMFNGTLTVGEQTAELAGLETLAKSHGLTASLFHKVSLDTSPGGYALAPHVAAAIDDAATSRPEPARAVLASPAYRAQRRRATRTAISDDQVHALLVALLDAPANRLDPESVAAALGVATVQLTGALSQIQRLLNIEQYPVISRDDDGSTVVLDTTLLRDQFGVTL